MNAMLRPNAAKYRLFEDGKYRLGYAVRRVESKRAGKLIEKKKGCPRVKGNLPNKKLSNNSHFRNTNIYMMREPLKKLHRIFT